MKTVTILAVACAQGAVAQSLDISLRYVGASPLVQSTTIDVRVFADLSGFTGSGEEQFFVTFLQAQVFDNGVPQIPGLAVFSDPPTAAEPGNLLVNLIDGELDVSGLFTPTNPNNSTAILNTVFRTDGTESGAYVGTGAFLRNELQYGFNLFSLQPYVLDEVTVNSIPSPGAAVVVLGLVGLRRRR